MRMGRVSKKRKPSSSSNNNGNRGKGKNARKKADTQNPNPPKFSSPTLVVGRIQSNVISSVLAPRLTALAVRSAEEYADRAMALADDFPTSATPNAEEAVAEVELDLDGNVVATLEPDASDDGDDGPILLFSTQENVDDLAALLDDAVEHFTTSAYKVHANAAKFERLLDEKYGRFRPFIEKHPQIETAFKNVQRKYAMGGFRPFRRADEMPLNRTTAVMILFMMQRQNVRLEALVLAAMFGLVGLQPWALVTLVALGRWEVERRKGRRMGGMPKQARVCDPYYARDEEEGAGAKAEEGTRAEKYAKLSEPVGTPYNAADLSLRDERHDVVLLGSGAETLYAGALLARAGRKVCVLSPTADASECAVPWSSSSKQKKGTANNNNKSKSNKGPGFFENVPFDVKCANVAHVARQQRLLAPALCTATDAQGGIRFARVGGPEDGYAHSVLSVPGLGSDGDGAVPVVINAGGPMALAEHCSASLGDGFPGAVADLDGNVRDTNDDDINNVGNSASLGYLKACRQIDDGAHEHYLSKLLPSPDRNASPEANAYRSAALRPASAFLDACLPLSPHVRSLMAAVGMANENLAPAKSSMAAHVSHLCAMTSAEGMAYPVGGPRAVCHALASVVEQCGGRVVGGALPQELMFETPEIKEEKKPIKEKEDKDEKVGDKEKDKVKEDPKPRCRGVRLQNGCEILTSDDGAVVSTLGLVPTFLHLMPADVRVAHGVPPGLPAVAERRPLLKLLVGLKGTRDELDLTGADWYRLPNATPPRDEMDEDGKAKLGTIGVDDDDEDETEAVADDAAGHGVARRGKQSKTAPKKKRPKKFTSGRSWMKVSFPSAKDPSWSDRHGAVSTCVVTIEADDDFVRAFDAKPIVYSILESPAGDVADRLKDRVMRDLTEEFPQLEGKVECTYLCGPLRSGLVQNPARFAITGNKPQTPFPGLFVGGSELTLGDSFSAGLEGGWLAANAVMDYSYIDLVHLKKNVTSDLERFLEEPGDLEVDGEIVEDLAVPFTAKVDGKKKAEGSVGDDELPTNPAEPSKEE